MKCVLFSYFSMGSFILLEHSFLFFLYLVSAMFFHLPYDIVSVVFLYFPLSSFTFRMTHSLKSHVTLQDSIYR